MGRRPKPANAAQCCRHPYRSLGVLRDAKRRHSSRNGGRSPAAAAAGNAPDVVGIVHGAESQVVAGPAER